MSGLEPNTPSWYWSERWQFIDQSLDEMRAWVDRQGDPARLLPLFDFRSRRVRECVATHARSWDEALFQKCREAGVLYLAVHNAKLPDVFAAPVAEELYKDFEDPLTRLPTAPMRTWRTSRLTPGALRASRPYPALACTICGIAWVRTSSRSKRSKRSRQLMDPMCCASGPTRPCAPRRSWRAPHVARGSPRCYFGCTDTWTRTPSTNCGAQPRMNTRMFSMSTWQGTPKRRSEPSDGSRRPPTVGSL